MAPPGGSLGEAVAQLATKLTSTNVLDISTAIDSLEAIRLRIQADHMASVQLSRTLQELSAFKRGVVLKTLLDRVLNSSGGLQMEMISLRALVKLAQCKGVVEFCLKEENYTKVLASYLTAQVRSVHKTVQEQTILAASRQQMKVEIWLIIIALACAVVRASRSQHQLSRRPSKYNLNHVGCAQNLDLQILEVLKETT